MPNKLLMVLDKAVLSLNKTANRAKAMNSKILNTITIIVLCCTIVAFFGKDELANVKFLKTAYYDTIVAYAPWLVDLLSALVGKVFFGVFMAALILTHLLRYFYRQPALLIAHSTMSHNLMTLDSSFKKSFYAKRVDIGVSLPSNGASSAEIISAIRSQDEAFKKIIQTNWRSNIFYYGVAHTPLIFRLGHRFGQTCRVRFLHRFRPTEDEQEFKELPSNDTDKTAWNINDKVNGKNESSDLLVAIATTYPIKNEDLRVIDIDNTMHCYKVEIDAKALGYDFFGSYSKIRSYADRIAEDIRQLVNEKDIKTIHLVISSSVPFTFYLSQQMNTNQFPNIIVYHYNHVEKYAWGIRINESDTEKAVVRCEAKYETKQKTGHSQQ